MTTLCSDCPPVGYPNDKTRCGPCPRRHEINATNWRDWGMPGAGALDLGFFAFTDPQYMAKLGHALRTASLRRYVKTAIRGREIIWDRDTAEVWSRPAQELRLIRSSEKAPA